MSDETTTTPATEPETPVVETPAEPTSETAA